MKRFISGGVGLLLVSLPAAAEIQGNVGVYYDLQAETDLLTAVTSDGDGFGLKAGLDFGGPTLHLEYRSVSGDVDQIAAENEVKTLRVGGGYRFALSEQVGLSGKAEYIDIEDDYGAIGLVVESDGFGVHVGADFTPIPQLGLGLSLGYVDLGGEADSAPGTNLDSDGLEYSVSVAYNINEMFAASLAYRQYMGEFNECTSCGGDNKTYEFTGLMLEGTYRFKF